MPLETDAWGLDVVVSGSQKALMTPPGLALVSVSQAAWDAPRAASPRFYFDWERTRAARQTLDAAFTPAVSLVIGLDVALGLLLEEGLEAVFERHVRLGRACREGVEGDGPRALLARRRQLRRRHRDPRARRDRRGRARCSTLRDRIGITLAGGQGPLKGKIFRIGHIGYFDVFDIATALAGGRAGAHRGGRRDRARRRRHAARSRRTSARRV